MLSAVFVALLQLASVESPVVHASGAVTVTIEAPRAREVQLWGDWQNGDDGVAMTREPTGRWTLTTAPLVPGPHLYAFVVDGIRIADPANRSVKNGFPGVSSIVEVPDTTLASLPRGVVHVHPLDAAGNPRPRTIHVYTPAGFGPRSFLPTLYLLHGSTDSDRDWLALGQAGFLLERAIRAGTARPMLLVSLDGHPHPSLDVSTRAENLRLLQREVSEVIAPLVQREYHPMRGAAAHAVLGASMGGAQALHLAARAPSLFGTVVALSAPPDIPGGQTLAEAWGARPASAPPVRVRLLIGRDDPFIDEARTAPPVLRQRAMSVEWIETTGGHDWPTWRRHLAQTLPLLFRELPTQRTPDTRP